MSQSNPISKEGLVATEMSVIYECPSNNTAKISSITISNDSEDYVIEVRKIINGEDRLLFKFTLDEGDIHYHTKVINLKQGEQIMAVCDVNTTEYVIEGIETFEVQ